MPDAALARSYVYCRRITRAAARNFYFAIFLLPRPKRDALCALYAFMRHADDISDTPGDASAKLARMAAWRATLDRALAGDYSGNPVLPAFHDAVRRYSIPPRYLHDLISGTEMDLSIASYATFELLRKYCYRVAGTVGLCCTHVFGFSDPRALEVAEKLGIAFQLTNILRDVRADYEMGRVYLPEEDLRQFGCRAADLAGPVTPAMRELLAFEAARAWQLFDEGGELLRLIDEDSRPALWALARIYSGILEEIGARGYDVFAAEKVRLSTAYKVWVMLRARLGWWNSEHGFQERDHHRRGSRGTLLGGRAG
ncbi:MAG TPA: phytoene/squalene synthase family protein [Candidatus Acidoferrales bacterium]|nr:phytoene/squalene synthase family protein [Candidatus Acidoferrales bacterium]